MVKSPVITIIRQGPGVDANGSIKGHAPRLYLWEYGVTPLPGETCYKLKPPLCYSISFFFKILKYIPPMNVYDDNRVNIFVSPFFVCKLLIYMAKLGVFYPK